MAAAKTQHHLVRSKEEGQENLFPATQSHSFDQARTHWQKSWQAVVEQCKDCFTRH